MSLKEQADAEAQMMAQYEQELAAQQQMMPQQMAPTMYQMPQKQNLVEWQLGPLSLQKAYGGHNSGVLP